MPPEDPFSHILAKRRDPQLRLAKSDPDDREETGQPLGPREYRAFEIGPKPARLIIQCSRGPSHSPAYGLLINVIFDRRFGGSFVLVFNFMAVTVTGQNLTAVVHAINHHRCTAITEFDPKALDAPAAGSPLIERIEVQARGFTGEQTEVESKGRGLGQR